MKKNLLYMLTAAAMLAGCAKNDVVDSEINKEGNLDRVLHLQEHLQRETR